jgi:hypothetical protein
LVREAVPGRYAVTTSDLVRRLLQLATQYECEFASRPRLDPLKGPSLGKS